MLPHMHYKNPEAMDCVAAASGKSTIYSLIQLLKQSQASEKSDASVL